VTTSGEGDALLLLACRWLLDGRNVTLTESNPGEDDDDENEEGLS
jgi:hypothetical protein